MLLSYCPFAGTSVSLLLLHLNADVPTTFAFYPDCADVDSSTCEPNPAEQRAPVYGKYGQMAQSVYEAAKYGLEHHADLREFFGLT